MYPHRSPIQEACTWPQEQALDTHITKKKTKPRYSRDERIAMFALANLNNAENKIMRARFSNNVDFENKERNHILKTSTKQKLNDVMMPGVFDDLISKEEAKKIVNQYYEDSKISEKIAYYLQLAKRPIGIFNAFNSERWRNRSAEINELVAESKYDVNPGMLKDEDKEKLYENIANIMISGGYIKKFW